MWNVKNYRATATYSDKDAFYQFFEENMKGGRMLSDDVLVFTRASRLCTFLW